MTARTISELAELLELSEARMLALMQDAVELGLVQQVNGRWRLTEHAQPEFGYALRAMDNSVEDASSFARPSYVGEAPA